MRKYAYLFALFPLMFILSGCLQEEPAADGKSTSDSSNVPTNFDMNGTIEQGHTRMFLVEGKKMAYPNFAHRYCKGLTKTNATCKKMANLADEDLKRYAQGLPLDPRPFN